MDYEEEDWTEVFEKRWKKHPSAIATLFRERIPDHQAMTRLLQYSINVPVEWPSAFQIISVFSEDDFASVIPRIGMLTIAGDLAHAITKGSH